MPYDSGYESPHPDRRPALPVPLPRPYRPAPKKPKRRARKCTPSPPRNDVWLYAEENEESGLFLLPYTYYVRVVERGEPFSAVVYGTDEAPYRAVKGYCKTELLTFVGFVPSAPS